MDSIKIIEAMSNATGTSGFETVVLETAKGIIDKSYVYDVDLMNNALITAPEFDAEKPYIAIDGHMDEVGLMVQAITAKGLLKVVALGGWDIKNLCAQKMRFLMPDGSIIKGIVSSVPVHFLSPDKRDKTPAIEDLLIDVGASSKEQVEAMGIEIGMPMVPDSDFEYQAASDVLIGKAFDDRIGCSLVIDCLNSAKEKAYTQTMGILSTQEEVGLRGSGVTANRIAPKAVIVFEGTPADDTFTPAEEAQSVLGKGVQIRIIDNSTIANPRLIKKVREIAEKAGIKHQFAVRRGGGTNAGSYQLKQSHIPSVVLGVPVRYIHSHYGIAKLEDYQAAKDLAMAMIKALHNNEFEL